MPTFEVQLPGGQTFEVDAPDVETASRQAQAYQVEQHPWKQFNRAVRSGQMPEGGKEFPGAGYVPTKGQAAGDAALLGGMIAAGPAAAAAFPAAPVLAPAAARAAVGAVPGLLQGDLGQSAKGAGAVIGVEALMSTLGLPGRAARYLMNRATPPPVVHQAANFQPPTTIYGPNGAVASRTTPPIVFNRPGGGQVTVQPPSSGAPITGGSSPAAILQEPLQGRIPAQIPQGARAAADYGAAKEPEITSGLLMSILEKAKDMPSYLRPAASTMVP